METEDRLIKWRLILGKQAESDSEQKLTGEIQEMDKALDLLYDPDRKAGLGTSSPMIHRWLGDIRKYFPAQMVQVMQKDALERIGLKQLINQPELLENIEVDAQLAATIISFNKTMPAKTVATAKLVVRRLVDRLEKKFRPTLYSAIKGSLTRSVRNHRPKLAEIDWNRTILGNLKNYQADLKAVIPERLVGLGRRSGKLRRIILLVDQSASMATSVVYAGILGAVTASIKSLQFNFIAFDTTVVDLSEYAHDPVELLFATQLGGGTDITNALTYARRYIDKPEDTILVLISDLFEGGDESELVKILGNIRQSGTQVISLLALDDKGTPVFNRTLAAELATLNIPCFACTPELFPDLMGAAIRREDLSTFVARG